jgi:hypothetical protein
MEKQRLVLMAFGVLAATFLGYWMIFGNAGTISTQGTNSVSSNISANSGSDYVSTASLPQKYSFDWIKDTIQKAQGSSNSAQVLSGFKNLTDFVATDLSGSFIANYKLGSTSTPSVNTVLNNSQSITTVTSNPQLDFNKPIDEGKLKLISDNSKSAKESYFKNLYSITDVRYFSVTPDVVERSIQSLFQDGDPSLAQSIKGQVDRLISKLYALSVPPDYLSMHKMMINNFQNFSYFYQLMLDYKNDPVKLMATQEYFDQLANDGQKVQGIFNQEFNKIAL